jgi:hypothetical protein
MFMVLAFIGGLLGLFASTRSSDERGQKSSLNGAYEFSNKTNTGAAHDADEIVRRYQERTAQTNQTAGLSGTDHKVAVGFGRRHAN